MSTSDQSPVRIAPEADEVLVKRALTGDKSAYGQLVSRYERKVYALVLEMVRHKEDAEDITQEVFVRGYFSLKNFRSESSFYTWVYRIAYNMTVDFKRRVARRPQDALASTQGEAEASNTMLVSNVQLPDEMVENRERQDSIRSALMGISEEHRAVILLREVDGLSYDEIAKVTGSARGTVMSRLHYARKHLQKVLRSLRPTSESGDSDSHAVSHGDRRLQADKLQAGNGEKSSLKRWKLVLENVATELKGSAKLKGAGI